MLTRQPPPPDFEWTAESIHSLRSHLGQSQAALARELGIRQQTVSEWETGMYKPRGASVTILTLLAVSSGFKFDQPAPREQAHEPAQRRESGGGTRRPSVSGDGELPRATSHPDWVRTSSPRPDVTRARNFISTELGRLGRPDGEIPL
jgi:transcriptional regulator with XRE-family HTH domain